LHDALPIYDLTHEIAKALELKANQGAFIAEVIPEGAADKAGLKSGDVIVAVNGEKIRTFADLGARVSTIGAGKELEITVLRDGEEQKFDVVLTADEQAVTAAALHPALDGIILAPDERGGLKVTEIEEGSLAERYGIRKDDVIIGVNRSPVNSMSELREALSNAGSV